MKQRIRRKQLIVVSLVIAFLIFLSAKIYQYSAAPTFPKNCDFLLPNNVDSEKPTTLTVPQPARMLEFAQQGGVVNDASCLNKTPVYGIVTINNIDDVKNALQFARENNLKVTSAGNQHSMGGQSFVSGGLVLDMKNFKEMKLDVQNKVLTVQSGAIWADVQQLLDAKGLSVKAMQSINIFTVGGTLSVNAHGIAHDPGPIASTVRSMHVMLSSGEVVTASPTENSELFKSVIGGYGLFGIILDVDLDVVDNEMYDWKTEYVNYTEFPEFYKTRIEGNPEIGLAYARLSVSPQSFLTETAAHTFTKTQFDDAIPTLSFDEHTSLMRFVINFSKTGKVGRWVRWNLEKYAVPSQSLCSRNQAMSQKEVCLISRNQKMYDSMGYLKNKLADTDILQEYFIPHGRMVEFVDALRKTVQENKANLLNVTIRIVRKDTVSTLPYAKEDMFAFVLYFNQKFNETERVILQKTTTDLIDVATNLGGTYYLPYQLYYSPEQLRKAYPEIDVFFEAKRKYDPTSLLTNTFYEKYSN